MAERRATARSRDLDGLRFVAFAFVFIHHAYSAYKPAALNPLVKYGFKGVTIFFVLSGFLIGRILLAQRTSEANLGQRLRAFYARRALRIFPLYYLFIVVMLALRAPLDVPFPDDALPWEIFFMTNVKIFLDGWWVGGGSHLWSLAVEEHFYLLAPAVMLLASRRNIAIGIVVTWIAAAVARGLLSGFRVGGFAWLLSPMQFDALAMGVAAAMVSMDGSFFGIRRARFTKIALACVPLFAGSIALYYLRDRTWNVVAAVTHHWLLCAGTAGIILLLAGGTRTMLGSPPLAWLGTISYALYLVHPVVLFILQRDHVRALGIHGVAVVALAVSIAIATASWFLFERRILAFKDRLAPYPG